MTHSTGLTSEHLERGVEYRFHIHMRGDDTSGEIWRAPGEAVWRYAPSSTKPRRSRQNPFRQRETVFSDTEDQRVLVIRRAAFLQPTFELVANGAVVGRITQRSILRNRYQIDLDDQQTWRFRMPLFTSRFHGVSDSGAQIFVRVGANLTQWYLLTEPRSNTPRLLFALAFIHNRAWHS